MALRSTFAGLFGVALLTASAATAADYRPGEFFSLDLSKAVLSPKPLGPPTEFAPVAVEAESDRTSEPTWAREELRTEPKKVAAETVKASHPRRVAVVANKKPTGAARTRLAHRHGNPLNAQALDTRIQVWPCRSGGICNWKQ
jgi:hypothetical protein